MIAKLIRKLGLGGAALALLRPFLRPDGERPDGERALKLLRESCPDTGGSCLCDRDEALRLPERAELDVIIPAYNVEAFLRPCLDSVLSQSTDFRFRVIVVDDGSTDGTADILSEYAAEPRLVSLRQENRGLSGARNTGLELSNARFVFFLDSDDMLCPGSLRRMMDAAAQSGADIVEAGYELMDMDGRTRSVKRQRDGALEPRRDCFGFAWGKLYSARLFSGLRFPPGYWYEDSVGYQVLLPLLEREGGKVVGVSAPAVRYRINPGGIIRSGSGRPKSVDSLWVTLSLQRDRERLGLENDRRYYEYILDMAALTYRRTSALPEELKRAVFAVLADFVKEQFPDLRSQRRSRRALEDALRQGSYGLYRAFCELI